MSFTDDEFFAPVAKGLSDEEFFAPVEPEPVAPVPPVAEVSAVTPAPIDVGDRGFLERGATVVAQDIRARQKRDLAAFDEIDRKETAGETRFTDRFFYPSDLVRIYAGGSPERRQELRAEMAESLSREPAQAARDFGAGLDVVGEALLQTPEQMLGSLARAWRGGDIGLAKTPEQEEWFERLIRQAGESADAFQAAGTEDQDARTFLPGITQKDIRELPQNMGFSFVSMAFALGAGVPTGLGVSALATPAVGAPAGYAAGATASGVAAFRMAKDSFIEDMRDFYDSQSMENRGRRMSASEWETLKATHSGAATQAGLFEAIPEAAGQALSFGIIRGGGKLLMNNPVMKNIIARTVVKFTGLQAFAHGTELITGLGQEAALVKSGQQEVARSAGEIVKDQAAQVFLLTTIMGGGAAVGSKAFDLISGQRRGGGPPPPPPPPSAPPLLTGPPEDIEASPLPTDLILEGRDGANREQPAAPAEVEPEPAPAPAPSGAEVTVVFPDGERGIGDVTDEFEVDGEPGVRIEFGDGTVYDGPVADIEISGPGAPVIAPVEAEAALAEVEAAAEDGPQPPDVAVEDTRPTLGARETVGLPEAKLFQWQANAQGGQTVGNQSVVIPLNEENYDRFLRPLDGGSLLGGEGQDLSGEGMSFEEWQESIREEGEPLPNQISLFKREDQTRFRVGGVGVDIATDEAHTRWTVEVDSFESAEAIEHGQTADQPIAPAPAPVAPEVAPVAETPPKTAPEAPVVAPAEPVVAAEPAAGGDTVLVDPDPIQFDAETFQIKSDTDAEGVSDQLKGVRKWDPMASGIAIIWENNDGVRFIVDGHQRLALAKRLKAKGQDVQLRAFILREADGVSAADARTAGAIKNLQEGGESTKAIDIAKVIRSGAMDDKVLRDIVPPSRKAYRDSRELAKLGDEAFGMADNNVIPPKYAVEVGRLLSEPEQQVAAINYLVKNPPGNVAQAQLIVEQLRDAGFHKTQGETIDIFGGKTLQESLLAERAKVLDSTTKLIRNMKKVFSTALAGQDILTVAGNVLDAEANQQELSENDRLVLVLKKLANRKGPIADALNDAARSLKDGRSLVLVRNQFLTAVKATQDVGVGDTTGEAARPDQEVVASVVDVTPAEPVAKGFEVDKQGRPVTFHATPHEFETFEREGAFGTGASFEGAGVYFGPPGVADWYRRLFAREGRKARIVTARLNAPASTFIDLDAKIERQSEPVQSAAKRLFEQSPELIEVMRQRASEPDTVFDKGAQARNQKELDEILADTGVGLTGRELYKQVAERLGGGLDGQRAASDAFAKEGIPGAIVDERELSGRTIIVFDERIIEIDENAISVEDEARKERKAERQRATTAKKAAAAEGADADLPDVTASEAAGEVINPVETSSEYFERVQQGTIVQTKGRGGRCYECAIKDARKSGGKFVLVDSIKTPTADNAMEGERVFHAVATDKTGEYIFEPETETWFTRQAFQMSHTARFLEEMAPLGVTVLAIKAKTGIGPHLWGYTKNDLRAPLRVQTEAAAPVEDVAPAEGATADGDAFFSKGALKETFKQLNASRQSSIYMTPREYLNLSGDLGAEGPVTQKIENIKKVLDEGTKLNSTPNLSVEVDADTLEGRVVGQEGRHRAIELERRGVEKIPVKILVRGGNREDNTITIRWGETTKRPVRLVAQENAVDPSFSIEFPDRVLVPNHNEIVEAETAPAEGAAPTVPSAAPLEMQMSPLLGPQFSNGDIGLVGARPAGAGLNVSEPGTEKLEFTVFDMTKGEPEEVGVVTVNVTTTPDGELTKDIQGLINIEVHKAKRGQKLGERITGALAASSPNGLRLYDIQPEARGFWEKMGAVDFKKRPGDSTLDAVFPPPLSADPATSEAAAPARPTEPSPAEVEAASDSPAVAAARAKLTKADAEHARIFDEHQKVTEQYTAREIDDETFEKSFARLEAAREVDDAARDEFVEAGGTEFEPQRDTFIDKEIGEVIGADERAKPRDAERDSAEVKARLAGRKIISGAEQREPGGMFEDLADPTQSTLLDQSPAGQVDLADQREVEEAAEEIPAPPKTDKLPKDLQGAKPRYQTFKVVFESDIDKALYITAQKRPSKRDADYRGWLTSLGFDAGQIAALGPKVRKAIGAASKTTEGDTITLSAQNTRSDANGPSGTTLTSGIDPATVVQHAKMIRADIENIVKKIFGEGPVRADEGIEVEGVPGTKDVNIISRLFKTPQALGKAHPEFGRLVEKGMKADIESSKLITRFQRIYGRIRKTLSKDQYATLSDIMLVADSEGVQYTRAHLEGQGIDEAVIKAYEQMNRMFEKIGRYVDQHERDMRPQYRERKAVLVRRMAKIRDMDNAEFRLLYNRRTRLRTKLKQGKGNPESIATQINAIEVELNKIREGTDEYAALRAEADQIETKLARLSVRRRTAYFPHKFFGTWRLFKEETRENEDGEEEAFWDHVAGEDGFFGTREDAIRAAREMKKADPDVTLRVAPTSFSFPNSDATQLSDPSYWNFMKRLQDNLGVEGEELTELVKGVARRRFRRRIAGFSQFRTGAKGYSKDVDRVVTAHIGETVRYVLLDKMKYDAITTMEKLKLSPNRSANKENPQLAIMMQNWFLDFNGQKRPGGVEEAIDNILLSNKPWTHPVSLGIGAGTTAFLATGGLTGNPMVGLAVGSWVGYRAYTSKKRGGQFPTRAFTGTMLGDMAHLKLGSFFNVFSPIVNLTQTLQNTFPVLGSRYTMVGLIKLAAASKSAVFSKAKGSEISTPNSDWRLLERADIASKFRFTEESAKMFERESRMAFWSLFLFSSSEKFNRAVAYLGAYHQAIDGGATHGVAVRKAEGVMTRTQFNYSNANKPEMLRNVLLRVPGQFKNFVSQEIAFAFGLNKKEFARFALSTFLLAGFAGLPGIGLVAWLMKLILDWDPIEEMKRLGLKAQAAGDLVGTMADVMIYGTPAVVGTDLSTRVGLGDKFLPTQLRDLTGPWLSTIGNAAALGEQNASIVDHLRNLSSGVGAPLKSLEAAANGQPLIETLATDPRRVIEALGDGTALLTNPWKNGNLELEPTTPELLIKSLGGTPLREAKLRAAYGIIRSDEKKLAARTKKYVTRIIDQLVLGDPANNSEVIRAVVAEASADGVYLTRRQIETAFENRLRSRAERTIRGARRQLRPEAADLLEAATQ